MYHNPVLLNESVESLEIKNGGIYVDLTFGGGGHSKEILKKIDKSGKLIAFDQDIDAHKNVIKDPRFHLLHQNFIYLKQNLEYLGINKVDGVLADLGVSSFQFDTNERGFTYANNSRLDMRMDVSSELDAVSLLNDYDESELSRIFFDFSDLRNSRKIAQLICVNRKNKKIQTSDELNKILNQANIDVHLKVWEGMWHVFEWLPDLPESKDSLKLISKFFERIWDLNKNDRKY